MEPVRPPPVAAECAPRLAARGFTAIELMVVIGILAILFALALPSFQSLIQRFRVTQAMEGMQATLYYARSEAIKRGGNVVVQKLPNGASDCSEKGDFSCGWVVCASAGDCLTSGATASGATILQRFDTLTNVEVSETDSTDTVKFNRWGLVGNNWFGFNFAPKGELSSPAARSLCMSSAGRIRMTTNSVDVCND